MIALALFAIVITALAAYSLGHVKGVALERSRRPPTVERRLPSEPAVSPRVAALVEPICERANEGKIRQRIMLADGRVFLGNGCLAWFTEDFVRVETGLSNRLNDIWSGYEMRESIARKPIKGSRMSVVDEVRDLSRVIASIGEPSPADREEQRRSFAYGNAAIYNLNVTRADIDRAAEVGR